MPRRSSRRNRLGTCALLTAAFVGVTSQGFAQLTTRLSILQAEDRRAPSVQDLATIRGGARSGDPQTARFALRALGRLERPALIPDILPGLRHSLPEVRAEAANAIAQAAQGLRSSTSGTISVTSIQGALIARLSVEADGGVRAALCEAIARLPYTTAADVERAESALLVFSATANTNADRLGLAKGLEALVRIQRNVKPPAAGVLDELKSLARNERARPEQELLRDARVRRLALDALTLADAADAAVVMSASADPDAQVRRLAVRAATIEGTDAVVSRALTDPSPLVRIEALRTSRRRDARETCSPALAAASDPDIGVALVAIDQLAACTGVEDAVAYLTHALDLSDVEAARNWHRAAHALLAAAAAAPDQAALALPMFARSPVWQIRMHAARAASTLKRADVLEQLAHDSNNNVIEAAITALNATVGHEADELYVACLTSNGYQVVRAAALALDRTPKAEISLPALKASLARFADDSKPGASDARAALRATLASIGSPVKASSTPVAAPAPLNAVDLRRLAAPRARLTIREVGSFDLALFTQEAPATVLRFVQLASSGYYNGLTFHRVVPNGVIQGGSPDANEYSSNAPLMRDEVGLWPHVRGAVGISTRGRDTGDGQIFIDLVDNPRYDHTYTVFAQVLNGLDVVDRILEGDVIESVEILP